MFTDLTFIDWVALIFAAILLAAAVAAGVVAYAATKNRPLRAANVQAAPLRRTPQHAAIPGETAEKSLGHTVAPTVAGAPAPPIMVPSRRSPMAVMSDGVRIEAKSAPPRETVAARAAKLRGRPIPESTPPGKKRVVSAVEPSRTPAHAPSKAFVGAHDRSGSVSIEIDSADGFAARSPGFFDDPVGRHELRYWDGHRWTEYVKEHGERFVDPL